MSRPSAILRRLFLTAGLLPCLLLAQEAAPVAAESPPGSGFWGFVSEMGFLAYPLAILSLLAVALVVLYTFTIRRGAVVSTNFMNAADSLIRQGDYVGLLQVCNRQNECIARITQKTLDFATKNPTASFAEVREVTEAEGSRQASLLNQRITYLSDIGAIAPMVGLLGTVIGMIQTFSQIGDGVKQMGLAGGVAQALYTTAGGLSIGIPALIFYSIFRGKVQRLISEMEAAATHIMALLGAQYKRAASQRSSQSRPSDSNAPGTPTGSSF